MYLIGVAGGSGSGKTTFAHKIIEEVKAFPGVNPAEIAILEQDHYYVPTLPSHLRKDGDDNYDHPEALDWALIRSHFAKLKKGGSVDVPVYDFGTSARTDRTFRLGPVKALLVEGIFALWDEEIRQLLDLKIYLHVEADIRFIRRLHRDLHERHRSVESIIGQYYSTVRPMHHEFVESTRQYANWIVGEENDVTAEVVAARVKDAVLGR